MAKPAVITLCVLNSLLCVFGSLMNSMVAFVISNNANLRKGLNLLILSLSVADLLNCAVSQPMYVYALVNADETSPEFKRVFRFVAFITLHASTMNLVAITLHRMKVLYRPFNHLLLVSKKQVLFAVVVVWTAAGFFGAFFATETGERAAGYFHLTVTLIWIGSFIGIFLLVRQHRRKITSFEGSPTSLFRTASLKYENEAAKTTAILVGSSIFCFFPDIVFDLMGTAEENKLAWGYTLLFLSSSLNPCLFLWRSQQFRAVLCNLCKEVRSARCTCQ